MTIDQIRQAIIALHDGAVAPREQSVFFWPESDYGKAEIWLIHDTYLVLSIPMYGGQPGFEKAFMKSAAHVEAIINMVTSWT